MERDLYRIMKDIYEKENKYAIEFDKFEVEDIEFIGTIETIQKINDIDTKVVKDIFKVIEKTKEDGSIVVNYYDGEMNFLGGKNRDGKMYPSEETIEKDIDIIKQIENLENAPGISFNELDEKLEEIAKEIGISKEELIASPVDLNQKIRKEKEDDEIVLEEDKEKDKEDNKNEDQLDKIKAKQEIDLNKKVDDRHTLGDVLGIESSSKLVAVYSNNIKNNKNTTRFSFIIKRPDGTLEKAENLNQIGGKHSDRNVYEMNRDGSNVSKQNVESSFEINSPIVKNGILTARIGQMGYIDIGYGQMDKTHRRDALTQAVETERTYHTTYRVREEFSAKQGTENIKENIKEIKEHEEHGCNDMTIDEVDGNENTGHKHFDENDNIIEEIKQYDENIGEVFTDKEIKEYLEKQSKKYSNKNFDEIVNNAKKELAEDASNIKTHNR